MKKLAAFIGLSALEGLLVLLPILLLILLLMEIFGLVVGLATPIADLFPAGTFDDPKHPVLLAFILIFAFSFLIGILMKSKAANRLGNWIQEKTVGKLPLYRFVKSLVSGLLGAEKSASFKPALFDADNDIQEIVYVIEDLGNGSLTALFPYAPTGFAGPVKVVPKDRIHQLDTNLGDMSLALNHMGLGAGKLLRSEAGGRRTDGGGQKTGETDER
jgi:uncharacterized membrane protein